MANQQRKRNKHKQNCWNNRKTMRKKLYCFQSNELTAEKFRLKKINNKGNELFLPSTVLISYRGLGCQFWFCWSL